MNEPRPATRTLLFVYGTLKRGEPRHRYLVGQTLIATVATIPAYRLLSVGDYPALVRRDDGRSIEGELWEIDEACVRVLDRVEGVEQGLYAPSRLSYCRPTTAQTSRRTCIGSRSTACRIAAPAGRPIACPLAALRGQLLTVEPALAPVLGFDGFPDDDAPVDGAPDDGVPDADGPGEADGEVPADDGLPEVDPGEGGAAVRVTVSELLTFASVWPAPETVVARVNELFVEVTGLPAPNSVPMAANRSLARLLRSVPVIVSR